MQFVDCIGLVACLVNGPVNGCDDGNAVERVRTLVSCSISKVRHPPRGAYFTSVDPVTNVVVSACSVIVDVAVINASGAALGGTTVLLTMPSNKVCAGEGRATVAVDVPVIVRVDSSTTLTKTVQITLLGTGTRL